MANARKTSLNLDMTKTDYAGRTVTARLDVTTDKRDGAGVWTHANVMWSGDGFDSCEIFGDFRQTLQHDRGARATQKTIDLQHAANTTPESLQALTAAAKAFYAAKASVA